MNKRALIGTIVWAVIFLIIISSIFFYFKLSSNKGKENSPQKTDIVINDTNKIALVEETIVENKSSSTKSP